MPRTRTLLIAGGAALLARRGLRRRIARSPLWPMPALDKPISGQGERRSGRADVGLRLVVAERTEPAQGVVQLRLAAEDGRELPAWEPGAHVDLELPSGAVRQYSLCGDPADRGAYTLATRLIPEEEGGRGGSREVHGELHEGTGVTVRGPRNRFPRADAAGYLFLAGGIGITPILPMVYAAEAAGLPWRVVYGGRTRAAMPFAGELEKLAVASRDGRVTLVPQDEEGHPDLAAALAQAPQGAAVHCCGPAPLMDAVTALCEEPGRRPAGGLHLERFTAAPAATGENHPFEVELRRTGRTLTVPADRTALETIRAEYPNTPYSCTQGFCGTCRTRVLEGDPDHRDALLTDTERAESMLICVSRCRGKRVVLDM